jgi:hypothetical protein
MLIRSWDQGSSKCKYDVKSFDLGGIKDDEQFRQYQDCLDQIERTERMLKLLWRELWQEKYPSPSPAEYRSFIEKYTTLVSISMGTVETAMITIRSLLGI